MAMTATTTGVVEIDGKQRQVRYHYVDQFTIECVDLSGEVFLTHYRSLLC